MKTFINAKTRNLKVALLSKLYISVSGIMMPSIKNSGDS